MHRLWVNLLLHEDLVRVIDVQVGLARCHVIGIKVVRLLHEVLRLLLLSAITVHSL